MKKYYEEPDMAVDVFRVEDMITVSGSGNEDNEDNTGTGGTEIINPFG